MSEVYRTKDLQVIKVVHEDGSETALKTAPSMAGGLLPDGKIDDQLVDRGKYSLFLSASVGCYMNCRFCHLTLKGCKYRRIGGPAILTNAKEAVEIAARSNPNLGDRCAKVCWMGMGEDAIARPEETRKVTNELCEWLIDQGYARGIDGCDLSTVLPRVKDRWQAAFTALDADLDNFPANPKTLSRSDGRSRFRLFYSLHSGLQQTRDELIPRAQPLAEALPALISWSHAHRISLIFHHLLVSGVNDTDEEISSLETLIDTYGLTGHELRLLRYNGCGLSPYEESRDFTRVAKRLQARMIVKVQASSGSEVRAACGQFIVKDYDDASELTAIAQKSAELAARHRCP
jgi:adenine C2-methylase RlmN of 23S rRNA A2503 and tRNA A37